MLCGDHGVVLLQAVDALLIVVPPVRHQGGAGHSGKETHGSKFAARNTQKDT
eukprot:CAMPEP_0204412858 /NCGR_PEP_ID=MMETSP0470-20130426/16782_1 /ASSEMBLY_ACC=CAM_ASM_000385 /TAXON_ID=2969 /ORGANISM="Oxyrrhis marina" /LENGTH=51 /DNA_ID=CAMNT_0051408981 /DNA_START=1 /DNA_END=156 /DNA_ORIENTATION=-